jgi:ribosomal protein S11
LFGDEPSHGDGLMAVCDGLEEVEARVFASREESDELHELPDRCWLMVGSDDGPSLFSNLVPCLNDDELTPPTIFRSLSGLDLVMIRSVLSSGRLPAIPKKAFALGPSLARPFTLSPSLRDGIFPDYPKQGVNYREEVPLREVDSQQPTLSPPQTSFASGQIDGPSSSSSPSSDTSSPFTLPPSSRSQPSSSPRTTPGPAPYSSPESNPRSSPTYTSRPSSSSNSSSTSRALNAQSRTPARRSPRPERFAYIEAPVSEISAQSDFIFDPDRSASSRQTLLAAPTRRKLEIHFKVKKSNVLATINWAFVKPEPGQTSSQQTTIPRGQYSGGSMGFKGANEGSNEAGYQVVMACFKRAMEENEAALEERKQSSSSQPLVGYDSYADIGIEVRVFLNGFGQGREAFFDALRSAEGEPMRQLITQLTDSSPVPYVLLSRFSVPCLSGTLRADHST